MKHLETFLKKSTRFYRFVYKMIPAGLLLIFLPFFTIAQTCPPNIDFEQGNFVGWTCYTGFVSAATGDNVISLAESNGPVPDRHTLFSGPPGSLLDIYGHFPVNCPNGSGYSIKLGNDAGGGQAEGISYEFTIPANENIYNLIYNYAVVFQDPNHLPYEQPRMEIEITNVTDNVIIDCSSFTFFPNGSPLPGFQLSDAPVDDAPVWFKNWTAVSINLDGNAGKTIRLLFKTADCTFRRHFGYAYIDVNSECSGSFIGASFCPDDTSVTVVAPFGYLTYNWYNSDFTQNLGDFQTLTLTPPPAVGTTLAVILRPWLGYGCLDTLYVQLLDNLVVTANAGRDTVVCNHNAVQLGGLPRSGLLYSWDPPTGLSDPNISNPYADPDLPTTYVITTRSIGGGCLQKDTVEVNVGILDNSLEFIGMASYCTGAPDPPILRVHATDSIQWYRDDLAIPGANGIEYLPAQTGLYYARLFSNNGCILNTAAQYIMVASIPIPRFTTNQASQCLIGNKFIFTNTSTNVLGPMEYHWTLGDGTEAFTQDVTHTFAKAGTYKVKLIVSSNTICADSTEFIINVYQNVYPEFIAKAVCIDLPLNFINNTADTVSTVVNYLWTFGNGQSSDLRDPPAQVYSSEGIYQVSLSVSTVQCPTPVLTSKQYIVVDKPKPGVTYPVKTAVINLPLDLQARPIGESVLWSPPTALNDAASFTPVFRSATEQLYAIVIKSISGCLTTDSQLVKIAKEIAIYVPNAFTPDDDGINDFLRPTLIGIKSVRSFRVFNRWGQLMFEMSSDRPGWNGKLKGVRQEMQTYIWIIDALGADGNIYQKKGTSILIR